MPPDNSKRLPASLDVDASTIRILICSANLGNAQPDLASLNEWIPLNGQCSLAMPRPPRFPVIMDPRRAQNPPPEGSPSPAKEAPPKAKPQMTKRSSNVSDSSSSGYLPETEPEPLPVLRAQAAARDSVSSRTSIESKEYKKWLERQQSGSSSGHLASEEDAYEAYLAKNKPPTPRSSVVTQDDYEAFLASQKNNPDRNSIEFRSNAAFESSKFDYDDQASFADLALQRSGSSSLEGFLVAQTPIERKNSSVAAPSLLSTKPLESRESIRFETNFDNVPPPPDAKPKKKKREKVDDECFDIIVIGMQEATFETGSSSKKEKQSNMSEDGSLSGSEEEDMDDLVAEINDEAVDPTLTPPKSAKKLAVGKSRSMDSSDDELDLDDGATPRKAKKSTAKKILGATVKAGKVGLKAGKKVTKVAKAVNTLVSSWDHTTRPLYSAQQANAPVADGGFPGWADTDVLHYRFEDQLPNYDRALSYQLGEMRLVIYYNPISIDLEVLGVKDKPTGKGGLANKGGIAAEVAVNGSTRLAFLTAHLEAHEGEEKYATRCTSFMDILSGTKSSFTPMKYEAPLSSHFTFFMGDLNFRTRLPGVEPGSERHIKICHAMTAARDWKMLNKYDELANAVRSGDCLMGWRTPYCNFDPTFKVARQDGYEYNVKRSPSYTDRILFKTGDQLEPCLRPILYEPIEHFTTSDHKPIRGAFSIRLNENLQWERAVSLKKTKKRSSKTDKSDDDDDDDDGDFGTEIVDREMMHFLVSSMSVVIDPDNYDKIRKAKKAELPNSYLSFVSTPADAMQAYSSKKSSWKDLLSSSGKGKPHKSSSDGKLKSLLGSSSKGFPTTTTVSDTMKPSWKKESLHFSIRTHLTNGDPIDLTGALLHITLIDSKDQKPFGAYSLNLAKLITVTKNPSLITNTVKPMQRSSSSSGVATRGGGLMAGRSGRTAGRMRDASPARSRQDGMGVRDASPSRSRSGGLVGVRDSSPARTRTAIPGGRGGGRGGTSAAGRGERGGPARGPIAPASPGGRGGPARGQTAPASPSDRKAPRRPSTGNDLAARFGPQGTPGRVPPGRGGGRSGQQGQKGWSYSSQPSAAMKEAATSENGYPTPVQRAAKSLSSSAATVKPQLDRRGSLKFVNQGPSPSMRKMAVEEADEPEAVVADKLRNLKIISLTLDEGLMEGGLEVARIKCNIDVWWTQS